MPAASSDINKALNLLDRGLDYHMSSGARAWGENALRLLKSGNLDDAVESLCNATAECGDPLASHYLLQARDLLAPDRLASA